jgi:DNA-binding CsgD family transcriptional regulator
MLGVDDAAASANRLASLSERELEVLAITSSGLSNAEAARRLDISVHGVKFHLNSVYRKLGVTNRTEAAVAYLEEQRRRLAAAGEA